MYKTPINSIQTNLSMLITANNDVDKMVDSSGGPLWLGGLKREKHSSHQRYSVRSVPTYLLLSLILGYSFHLFLAPLL